MVWLISKFGWLTGLALALVGVLFLPADFLDAQQAVSVWTRVFTVGNREILLIIICVMCLLRLWYMDTHRALNDQDWPPIRDRVYSFLTVLFHGTFREAKFQKIASDDGAIAYKKALLAEHVLKTGNFDPIPQMRPPHRDPPPPDFTGDSFGEHLQNQSMRVNDRVGWLTMQVGASDQQFQERIQSRMKGARERAYADRAAWDQAEEGGYFASDWARNRFHELRFETEEANRIVAEFKQQLESQKDNWHQAIDEDTRRRLLQDIAIKMKP